MTMSLAFLLLAFFQDKPAAQAPAQSRPAPEQRHARAEEYKEDEIAAIEKLPDADREKRLTAWFESHPQLAEFMEHHKRLVALEGEGKDGKKKVDEYLEAHPRVKAFLKDHPDVRAFLKKHDNLDKFMAKHPEIAERAAKKAEERHEKREGGGEKPQSRPHGKS